MAALVMSLGTVGSIVSLLITFAVNACKAENNVGFGPTFYVA